MKRTIVLVALASVVSLFPLVALAQCAAGANGFVPLSCAQASPLLVQAYASQNLSDYFNALFKIAISLGAIIAVIQIVRAGYLYMLKDSVSLKQNAREIFSDAIIGLLILLSVWLILYQINPGILNLDFVKTDFTTTSPGGTSQSSSATPGFSASGSASAGTGGSAGGSANLDTTAQDVTTGVAPQG